MTFRTERQTWDDREVLCAEIVALRERLAELEALLDRYRVARRDEVPLRRVDDDAS